MSTSQAHEDSASTGIEGAAPEGRLKRWSARTELIKSIVQTLAILGAAIWALYRFEYSERPSIDKRLQLRSNPIAWFEAPDPDFCMGKLEIAVKNASKQLVSIKKIRVSAWMAPVPPSEPGKAAYIDPDHLRKGTLVARQPIEEEGSLIGDYGPDIEAQDDYVFKMRHAPGQIALFQFDATMSNFDAKGKGEWRDWQWDYVCGEREKGEVKRKANEAQLRNDELRALLELALKRLEKR